MSDRLRLFIAIEPTAEIRAALGALTQWLRRGNHPVKWVAPEAIHLTLQFLGETSATLLPEIGVALRAALAGYHSHDLRLGSPGAFPNTRRPQVLWVGIQGDIATLGRVQASITAMLAPLGFPPEERPFHAHLTLGRVRREASSDEQQRLGVALQETAAPAPLVWPVKRVILFQSELRREGPTYTARDAVEFEAP